MRICSLDDEIHIHFLVRFIDKAGGWKNIFYSEALMLKKATTSLITTPLYSSFTDAHDQEPQKLQERTNPG